MTESSTPASAFASASETVLASPPTSAMDVVGAEAEEEEAEAAGRETTAGSEAAVPSMSLSMQASAEARRIP
eukprot:CAMPEP_0173316584 /NCGR_PEP_ID=MMETSP1143-20121109/26588_1 /TAXON_ID=483371 /ORGANISM="non described non described, Strain CCMP2298" /LENGTH=71 /DNA_ID=CAMNT_0014259545 /DNA_START=303 /DNA_END=514 /DNA_ORIENTATION=+